MSNFTSTKVIELGSSAFRQWRATHSHCQYLHGYQLKAKFWFGCSELDDKQWAADFGNLKDLKQKLQNTFDHKMLVAADDPLLADFKALEQKGGVQLSVFEGGVGIERAAEHCFKIASECIQEKYGKRVWVEKVEVFEHEDNSAVYSATPDDFQVACGPLKTVNILSQNPIEESPWGTPVTELTTTSHQPSPHHPTQVSQQVTSGRGEWFAGTSWGTK